MSGENLVILAVIGIIFAVWCISGLLAAYRNKRAFLLKLSKQKGQKPVKKYEDGELANLATNGIHPYQIDDITWNDLSMEDVFRRMDYTYSQSGEQALYEMLRSPAMDEDILLHREEVISYFEMHDAERMELQVAFARIGRNGKYSLPQYLSYLAELPEKSNLRDWLMLCVIAVSTGLLFVIPDISAIVLAIALVFNFITYLKEKGQQSPYIITFAYVMRFLKQMDQICKACPEVLKNEKESLQSMRKQFSSFERGSFLVTSANRDAGNPVALILDYICMFLHIDLMKYRQMHRAVADKSKELLQMFEMAGQIEALISIALYRSSLDVWCKPKLLKTSEFVFETSQLVHPLLENAVSNDLTAKQSVLLTGSNASGKSTFLKALAIASIMAQSVHTVTASELTSNFTRVYSSMSLRDNLLTGESYFIVEIGALKRIFDALSAGEPVRAFVDEVLRGTNTAERIAASQVILESLHQKGAQMFAATHDLELTSSLADSFENYHFEEKIVDGDVLFSYDIKKGPATSRNAIALLSAFGFDDAIVEKARLEFEKQFTNKNV